MTEAPAEAPAEGANEAETTAAAVKWHEQELQRLQGGYQADRATRGFTRFTVGNRRIPATGVGNVDNSARIKVAPFRKNGVMNTKFTNRQGIQEINNKRWKQWEDSPVEHTKDFKPYDVETYSGPGPLKGRTIAWAEANKEPGWQPDERIVAIDGYRVKRLPNKHILAQYIQQEGVKRPEDRMPLKLFAAQARNEHYKEKHNGQEMPPSAIAEVGKVTGKFYQELMQQYGKVVQYEKRGKDGKIKRGFHVVQQNGTPFPKGLFARINADMYNQVVEQVFAAEFNNTPFEPTKENKQLFSADVAAYAPRVISREMVEQSLKEQLGL
jgi:hypothetical protein